MTIDIIGIKISICCKCSGSSSTIVDWMSTRCANTTTTTTIATTTITIIITIIIATNYTITTLSMHRQREGSRGRRGEELCFRGSR